MILSTSPQIMQLVSQEADPRVQALTLLYLICGVQLLNLPWVCCSSSGVGGASSHLPKQLPITWAAPQPLPPFPAPSHSHVGKHPASPQAGDADLHNLIKFCILVLEGAGL